MILKFIPIETSGKVNVAKPERTLSELIRDGMTYEKYLQYQGFESADGKPVYQGDVLELRITDELMDINKDGFSNSNLGKDLKKHPKVISVLCHIKYDDEIPRIGCHYDIYYMDRDRRIVNAHDEPEIDSIAMDCEYNFPMYLCQKGATVIANTVTATTDVFEHIADYTDYTKLQGIPQHAVMNSY